MEQPADLVVLAASPPLGPLEEGVLGQPPRRSADGGDGVLSSPDAPVGHGQREALPGGALTFGRGSENRPSIAIQTFDERPERLDLRNEARHRTRESGLELADAPSRRALDGQAGAGERPRDGT